MKVGDTVYFEDMAIRHCYNEGTLEFLSDKLAVITHGIGNCFVECIRLNDPPKILAESKTDFYDKCIDRMKREIDQLEKDINDKQFRLSLLVSAKNSEV